MKRFYINLLLILLITALAACDRDPKPEKLKASFTAYNLRFQLPEGWHEDDANSDMDIYGGRGFASPEYAGRTYLRFHQGAGFAVLGGWEPAEDATAILEASFAFDISEQTSIRVLGYDGTYAHGKIDQGQGIGAVHMTYEDENGDLQQLAFVGVVANYWEEFEPTFLEIIGGLQFENG